MIDITKMMEHMYGECLYFLVGTIGFQCSSDDSNNGIACSAGANIKLDNSFEDWDNF